MFSRWVLTVASVMNSRAAAPGSWFPTPPARGPRARAGWAARRRGSGPCSSAWLSPPARAPPRRAPRPGPPAAGLARAVRPEDPEDLALVHGEGDVADRHGVPVRLVQRLR